MNTTLLFSIPPSQLRIGLIEADGIQVGPSPEDYIHEIEAEIKPILSPGWIYPDHLQKGIRSLLKYFGFHPSGRNRPASEYLVKDLLARGCFHAINNVVDINNHLSLVSHLPISIVDLDLSGERLCLRLGNENEEYVFNREGQILSLKNLIVLARAEGDRRAIASPIKDSHSTKISESTKRAFGVIYTSATITPEDSLAALLQRFADLLKKWAKATYVDFKVIDAPR